MLKVLVRDFANKMGINKAIAYSSGTRIIQGVTGILSVLFIATFLSGVEQGFYYTFGSILALQIFFELGFTGIMTQYVAHEVSHLSLNKESEFIGEEQYRSRLASLVHFCVKWYAILGVLVLFFLLVIGKLYFQKYGDSQAKDVVWLQPWVLICVGTAIKLFQSPLTAILSGLGFVKETSKIGFFQQIIIPLFSWIGLGLGLKLYVIGIGYILSVIVWQIMALKMGLWKIIINLWKIEITERVLYFKEIFPYQWRIALSWISGYFIFQLFNPILFATEGSVVAGQMGLTLQALNAIQAFSMSWMKTKIPLYSKLIALKDYIQLDTLFNKTQKQMLLVCTFLLLSFYFVLFLLDVTQFKINETKLIDRFIGFIPLFFMSISVMVQQFIDSWATYLRCHKRESWLLFSIVLAVLCTCSTFFGGRRYGLYGVTIGYCIIKIATLPWGYWIYKTNKQEWHDN